MQEQNTESARARDTGNHSASGTVAQRQDVAGSEDAPFLLEEGKRLSESFIWNLQQTFFERSGIEAWRSGVVPHYVTSNPFIAKTFAAVVRGFLRDCHRSAPGTADASFSVDRDHPIDIVELGCGHGRFGFHFLKKLKTLHENSALAGIRFRYIMSDLSEANVDYWQSHPSLQQYLQSGLLDLARFDPVTDSELVLRTCGDRLSPGYSSNPMVFIANYLLDSVPQDAFYIKEGRLHESLVRISSPQEEPDRTDPGILSRIHVTYEHIPVQGDYYDDAEWNRILAAYTERLADTSLLFPTGPLTCVRNLASLSGGRMLLLSADHGDCREEELQGRHEPKLARHGCASVRVNYHAIGRFLEDQGGVMLHPRQRPASLTVAAFLLGGPASSFTETRLAYTEAIDEFGPDDCYALKEAMRGQVEQLNIRQALAFLRLTGWDARVFIMFFPVLMRQAKKIGRVQKREIAAAIERVWSNYFHLGERADVPFHLGTLLCQMRYYREALELLGQSIEHYGEAPETAYNMALCYDGLRELDKARERIDTALRLKPDYEPARAWRIQIEAALAATLNSPTG